jgi:hypothetical protein
MPDDSAHDRTDKKKKGRPWRKAFLVELKRHGNIVVACNKLGVGRRTVYDHRRRDPVFDQAVADAVDEALDMAEAELYRRAVQGEEHVMLHKGEPVLDPKTGEPIKFKRRSDLLLMFYLKAKRPEFRENANIEGKIKAAVDHAIGELQARLGINGAQASASDVGGDGDAPEHD